MYQTSNIYEAAAIMAAGVPLYKTKPGKRVRFQFDDREHSPADVVTKHNTGTLSILSRDYAFHLQNLKMSCAHNREDTRHE